MVGDLNAFTSRENTAFYVKVLDEYADKGIELLSDIFLHSTFDAEEIEKEKGVIKEEIKMVEDTPDDYIHDLFNAQVYGNMGLGMPVVGTKETVKSFTREKRDRSCSQITTALPTRSSRSPEILKSHKFMDRLNHYMGDLRRGSEPEKVLPPTFRGGIGIHPKDLSEAHITLGVPAIAYASPDRYVIAVLNSIFGSSVSSRLFQEIREKKGYAYSIYSFVSSYRDCGYMGRCMRVLAETCGDRDRADHHRR